MAPDLVNRLLNEMGTDPDQLPLMQHLLMRMWTWQSPQPGCATAPADTDADAFAFDGAGRALTLADYDAVGGLRHALSNHADEAFEKPDWVGEEVTHDVRYYNTSLCRHPFKDWA